MATKTKKIKTNVVKLREVDISWFENRIEKAKQEFDEVAKELSWVVAHGAGVRNLGCYEIIKKLDNLHQAFVFYSRALAYIQGQ